MKIYEKILNSVLCGQFATQYSHLNKIIDGQYLFDCSGFVEKCLAENGFKRALVEIRSVLKKHSYIKQNRFYCQDFYKLIVQEPRYWKFLAVNNPQLAPGDILIVIFPNSNGHCMFIDNVLEMTKSKIALRVVDSTQFPHKNDTRCNGQTGIGAGEVLIEYDSNNQAYYNSLHPGKDKRPVKIYFVRPIK